MTRSFSVADIQSGIDHAILKPEYTRDEVAAQLDLAAEFGVFSVCVRPCDVAFAVERLQGRVAVGAVIGFPHGTTSTAAKVAEARQAIADGAQELDMVLNIGMLRSGLVDEVKADIAAVVAVREDRIVKVIFETVFLDDEQIVAACRASTQSGAQFVKTSTGFAGGGATVEHVKLMRASIGPDLEVKASGGVRSLDALLDLRAAGATRFGTSSSASIITEARARERGEIYRAAETSSGY